MKTNRIPGGNGRAVKFQAGRAMGQTKPGGLVLPAGVAAEQAKAEAEKWKPIMLSWCPIFGPFVVSGASQPVMKPHPMAPPKQMPDGTVQYAHCPWVACPTCGELHMVAGVLTETTADDDEGLTASELAHPARELVDDDAVGKLGRDTGESSIDAFPALAAFQIQREDAHGPEGHLAGMVVTAVDDDFAPCIGDDGDSSVLQITIDGADKADLQRRVMLWVDGLRAGSGKPAYFGGTAHCKAAFAASRGQSGSTE